MSEIEYGDFFADFYEVLHSHLDDVKAYKRFTDRFGTEILELGSGTGRILIPLAREGNLVTGLEASEDMLNACREKLEEEDEETRENIELVKGDIRDFDLNQNFDLVLASCNLINYLKEVEDLKRTLSCVKDHLAENGVLIIDNSLPDLEKMVRENGEEQVFEYTNPKNGRKIVDKFTARYDFVEQIEKYRVVLSEFEGGEKTRETSVEETLTFYFPRELRNILRSEGFEIFEERGSLHEYCPITEESEEMVFFCRV